MKRFFWLFFLALPVFAEDTVEEHFFDKDGNPCSVAKWMSEIKSGTLYKSEKATYDGLEYTIETRYSGIDTRDPKTTPDFKPLIFKTVVIGPTQAAKYDGFIARYEYQIDAKAKADEVKAKIIAGTTVDDLAKDEGQVKP